MSELLVTIQAPIALRPKPRPRAASGDGRIIVHSTHLSRAFERQLGTFANRAMAGRPAFFLPLRVVITATFQVRASWSRQKRLAALREGHVQVPDYDNLAKAVGDALNCIVWEDDRQIVDGRLHKLWGEADCTTIEVYRYSVGVQESEQTLIKRIQEDNQDADQPFPARDSLQA